MTRVETSRDAFEALAAEAPPTARIPVAVTVTVDDPFTAYRRARDPTGGVYLGTTGGQSGWGYFATAPAEFTEVGPDGGPDLDAMVGQSDGESTGDTLDRLTDALAGDRLVRGDCEVPYPCGAIGWLSYDVVRELESIPGSAVDDRVLPRLQLATYDRIAAWKEPRGEGSVELTVTACPRLDDHDSVGVAYEFARQHALELARKVSAGDPDVGDPPVAADSAAFESDCTRASFAERVHTVKQYIRDGDTFQANVSQRLSAPAAVHPVEAFDALRRVNPAPYSALVEFPGVDLVSASPELLLHRDGDDLVTEPIAGTRPRGSTAEEDERLAEDLRADEKERAEHAMLVDLERNDLGKVSRFGSVEVTDYRRVDRYPEVMHLVSDVTGRLRDGVGLAEAVGAMFPGGTITGAPKPRTMEIIDELESTRRGPYTGAMAAFGFDDRATLNIVIRTLVRYGDEYHLRVGAGVVHDSEPEREYDETLDKARALLHAVDDAIATDANLTVTEADR